MADKKEKKPKKAKPPAKPKPKPKPKPPEPSPEKKSSALTKAEEAMLKSVVTGAHGCQLDRDGKWDGEAYDGLKAKGLVNRLGVVRLSILTCVNSHCTDNRHLWCSTTPAGAELLSLIG